MLDRTRRRRRFIMLLVATVVILAWIVVLVLVWRSGTFRVPLTGGAATEPPGQSPGQTATTTAPVQPAADGYEYLVTEERYAVIQEKGGPLEIQERRRESWRTPDGWAWARQTGTDPGRFIFSPLTDWKPIRQARPNSAEVEKAMNALLVEVPRTKIVNAQFNFVSDLLGAETLPAASLPVDYRSALVEVLSGQPGVTTTSQALDPKGRSSTRLSFTRVDSGVRVTQSLYLDRKYGYLASTTVVAGSEESGSRVVIERRHANAIPPELLAEVGDKRVERVIRDR